MSEYSQIVRQLTQKILDKKQPGSVFGQQLLRISSQCLELNKEQINIGALPILVCQANRGDSSPAIPVNAAWQMVRLAAKLLDDVEDREVTNHVAQTINTAVAFLYLAQSILWELSDQGVANARVQRMCQSLNQAILQACSGQHLDLISKVNVTMMDPDTWLEIAAAKSGVLLAWAAWAGALVSGADEHRLACYYEYGYQLGLLLQVADDFNGVWTPDGISDLANNSFTLPVCYALSVTEGEERKRLKRLLKKTLHGDAAAEAQARQMMIETGAQAYLLVVGKLHYQQALTALQGAGTGSQNSESLFSLLDGIWPAVNRSEN